MSDLPKGYTCDCGNFYQFPATVYAKLETRLVHTCPKCGAKNRILRGRKLEVFNEWAGNPNGTLENIENCIESVPERGRSALFYQCKKKRGYGKDGLYCAQHAKKYPEIDK